MSTTFIDSAYFKPNEKIPKYFLELKNSDLENQLSISEKNCVKQ